MVKNYLKIWKLFFNNFILSFYSIQFYENVYKDFKGMGLKHLLLCCIFVSVVKTCIVFVDSKQMVVDLKNGRESKYINLILTQLPTIEYDGNNISVEGISDNFLNITSPFNNKQSLLIINLNDQIKSPNNALITLYKQKLVINTPSRSFMFPYKFLDTKPQTIDSNFIKELFISKFDDLKNLFLYNLFIVNILFFFDSIIYRYIFS